MKILLIFLIICITPFAYGHPDTLKAAIGGNNQYSIIDLKTPFVDNSKTIESEFLSIEWFWENFILLLSVTIVLIMVPVFVIIYKEEVFGKIKKTM